MIEEVAEKPRAQSWAKDTWCVWTKWGRRPSFFHPTRELAEAEAERLALANPKKNFLVLHMVSKFGCNSDGNPEGGDGTAPCAA